MLEHNLQIIGNKLLTIRKKLGMTQVEIAEAADLSDRTYADIERGCVNMRLDTLLRICEVLHITPNEILTCNKINLEYQENALFQQLHSCSEKDRNTALRLLDVYLQSLD